MSSDCQKPQEFPNTPKKLTSLRNVDKKAGKFVFQTFPKTPLQFMKGYF
jgi:hypothetical protein